MAIASLASAGIGAAASLFGGSQQASASKKAAQIQAQAQQQATQAQMQMFGITQNNLAPFMAAGRAAAGSLNDPQWTAGIDLPTAPLPLTQAELEATPGYQFTLGQGLKATQNSAAARGLGLSGAALKGAATFATGLSDQTYNTRWQQRQGEFGNQQQLFADKVSNRDAGFNKLFQVAGLGGNAAAGIGNAATTTGSGIANTLTSGANAQAASTIAGGNAMANAATGVGNALMGGISGLNSNAFTEALLKSKGIDLSQYGLGAQVRGLFS